MGNNKTIRIWRGRKLIAERETERIFNNKSYAKLLNRHKATRMDVIDDDRDVSWTVHRRGKGLRFSD